MSLRPHPHRLQVGVQSLQFYSAEDDGLQPGNPWTGRVYVFPPVGMHGNNMLQVGVSRVRITVLVGRCGARVRLGKTSDTPRMSGEIHVRTEWSYAQFVLWVRDRRVRDRERVRSRADG